jgi:hypothetical protein
MNDRDILIEILAIKLYEHDAGSKMWPPSVATAWNFVGPEDREVYRDMIKKADTPEALFDGYEGLK